MSLHLDRLDAAEARGTELALENERLGLDRGGNVTSP